MKIAVTNFATCSDKSIIASNTLAKWLAQGLDADLLDHEDKFQKALDEGTVYDAVVAINGIPTFCKYRDQMYKFWCNQADNKAKFYWVGNDYSSKMRIQTPQWKYITERTSFKLVAAFDRTGWGAKFSPEEKDYVYVNWNQLTYTPGRSPRYGSSDIPDNSILYYGAARENRFDKFAQYFSEPGPLNLFMSVPSYKAEESISKRIGGYLGFEGWENENWRDQDPKDRVWLGFDNQVKFLKKFNLATILDEVRQYPAVLLIEDYTSSHGTYTSPPNRFYEYMSSGTLMMVDSDAAGTLISSGVPAEVIEPLVVRSNQDIADKLANRDELLKHQYENIYLKTDYLADLQNTVVEFFSAEGLI